MSKTIKELGHFEVDFCGKGRRMLIKLVKQRAEKAMCFLLYYSGFLYLLLFIRRLFAKECISIFNAHRVIETQRGSSSSLDLLYLKWGHALTSKEFERKIMYLKKHYEIISLKEAVERIKNRKKAKNSAVLTFDDGYQDMYDIIFPLLIKHNIPATIFLTTGIIDSEKMLWWDKLALMLDKTKVDKLVLEKLRGKQFDLRDHDRKAQALSYLGEKLKWVSEAIKNEVMEEIFRKLKVNGQEVKHKLYLNWNEIKEMAAFPLVSFGVHTVTHPNLTTMLYRDTMDEILASKQECEEKIGRSTHFFSYPYGQYDESIKQLVVDCGFLCACATAKGDNDDLYALKRVGFSGPFYVFAIKASSIWNFINSIKNVFKSVYIRWNDTGG